MTSRRRIGSDEARAWARKLSLNNALAKGLLQFVCNYVSDDGVATVSLETLSEDSEQSVATVRRRLRWLEEMGVVALLPRWIDGDGRVNYDGRGRQVCSDIRLNLDLDLIELAMRTSDGQALGDDAAGPAEIRGSQQQPLNSEPGGIRQQPLNPVRGISVGVPVESPPIGSEESSLKKESTPKSPSVPEASGAPQQAPPPAERPQGGIQGEQAAAPEPPGLDRLIRNFSNPALVNRAKTLKEFLNLSAEDQHKAEDIAARFAADCRRLKKAPKRLHLWLRDRDFANYVGSTGALRFVPAKDPGGGAVRVLAALLGNITVPSHWGGRDEGGGAYGYWLWFELEPRFLGLAQAQAERHRWPEFRVGSQHHGAWQSFVDAIMGPERRKHLPTERGVFRAPWPWPPRVDGTLSSAPEPSSTGPPPELSSAEQEEFSGSM